MKKRIVRYPATIAFRTTNEIKAIIEMKASNENKTSSEVLQKIVITGLTIDPDLKYNTLVCKLASILQKDNEWIKRKLEVHYSLLSLDAHHGYNQETAIHDIEYEIEVYSSLPLNP